MIRSTVRLFCILFFLLSMMIVPTGIFCEDMSSGTHNITEIEARDIIERAYLDILQRYPDERGLYTYSKLLSENGKSEEWLRGVLLNSEEGQQVSKRKQKKTFILYAVIAFPLIFIGIAFYFRKSTKDFILNSLLVLFSIFIACLFLEIALRITTAYQDKKNERTWSSLDSARTPKKNAAVFLRDIIQLSANPNLIYELMPNLYVRFMREVVTTDNNGFRVTPGSCEKEGSYTIIGLGDSVMFGWGVHDQETYLEYLAQNMSKECTRIINMAVPGYNTVMEVETLKEKGLRFHPDLVLIHFVDNDLNLPNFIRKKDKHITLTRSYLQAALSRWLGTRTRTRPFEHLVRNSGDVPDEYKYMAGVDGYRRAMIQLKEMSIEHDFKILLLSNWTAPDYVSDITKELKIPSIELGKPLLKYVRDNRLPGFQGSVLTVSKNDPHYSPIAHRIVADEVYQYLLQKATYGE